MLIPVVLRSHHWESRALRGTPFVVAVCLILTVNRQQVVFDDVIDPTFGKKHYIQKLPPHVMNTQTTFWFVPQKASMMMEALPVQQLRRFERQVRDEANQKHVTPCSYIDGKPFLVAEVFSPPRFAPLAEQLGFASRSYDLKTGVDFRIKPDRCQVARELKESPPELLILCPPCTDEGGGSI